MAKPAYIWAFFAYICSVMNLRIVILTRSFAYLTQYRLTKELDRNEVACKWHFSRSLQNYHRPSFHSTWVTQSGRWIYLLSKRTETLYWPGPSYCRLLQSDWISRAIQTNGDTSWERCLLVRCQPLWASGTSPRGNIPNCFFLDQTFLLVSQDRAALSEPCQK